jgi:hypothetical protein
MDLDCLKYNHKRRLKWNKRTLQLMNLRMMGRTFIFLSKSYSKLFHKKDNHLHHKLSNRGNHPKYRKKSLLSIELGLNRQIEEVTHNQAMIRTAVSVVKLR